MFGLSAMGSFLSDNPNVEKKREVMKSKVRFATERIDIVQHARESRRAVDDQAVCESRGAGQLFALVVFSLRKGLRLTSLSVGLYKCR